MSFNGEGVFDLFIHVVKVFHRKKVDKKTWAERVCVKSTYSMISLLLKLSTVFAILLIIGVIESNRGPSLFTSDVSKESLKTVRGSFSQGCDKFSELSRGKQCMANCMVFILYASKKEPGCFSCSTLNEILDVGNSLYCDIIYHKNVGHDLLLFSVLPNMYFFDGIYYNTVNRGTLFGGMSKDFMSDIGHSLESPFNLTFARDISCILVFHGAAVSVYYDTGTNRYFVFDSHSRGFNSLCHPDGTSVLTIASSLQLLCSFLRSLCLSLRDQLLTNVQYELNIVRVNPLDKPSVCSGNKIYTLQFPETHLAFPIDTFSAYSYTVEHSDFKRMRIDLSGSECFDEEWRTKTKSVAYCCVLGLLICQNNFSHLNDEILHMMESCTQVLLNSWLKCPESIDTKLCSPTYYKFGNSFFFCEAKDDVIQFYCYRSSE